ncbi:hypothetical protein CWI36_0179p0010 [Hamiltosporidium magnivora]|uniref:Uncharacterized protein n=1 Tax=Hamiltosporidium magnivora TaxID=148818 RepID=A0A4Q9LL77_9MICR|nr:hypothetical protein CWI36_0179p0010 [Hamiltosporidium magnivora]
MLFKIQNLAVNKSSFALPSKSVIFKKNVIFFNFCVNHTRFPLLFISKHIYSILVYSLSVKNKKIKVYIFFFSSVVIQEIINISDDLVFSASRNKHYKDLHINCTHSLPSR